MLLRNYKKGKVTRSPRPVWRLTEDDLIDIAAQHGIELTPEQLDELAARFNRLFCPTAWEWLNAIDEALREMRLVARPGQFQDFAFSEN